MAAKPEPQCCSDIAEQSTLGRSSVLRSLDQDSAELLHELNNVFVTMLLNAQVMEWKLPSYSHLKRNLHEVQRNAQRGGELTKRLQNRLAAMSRLHSCSIDLRTGASDSVVANSAVADQEPDQAIRSQHAVTGSPGRTAPVIASTSKKVPHTPV